MIDNDKDRYRQFSRRAFLLGGVQTALLCTLGARLGYLQIAQGQKYATLSDRNRIDIRILPPARGEIVDRYGVPLAANSRNMRLIVTPEQIDDMEALIAALQRLIQISSIDLEKAKKQMARQPAFMPVELRDDLQWEDVAKVEVNLPDLPGVSIIAGSQRHYPYREATAHMVGYVGAVSKKDVGADPLLALPGFQIGKTGIERLREEDLRGSAGSAQVEVNVVGREVRELRREAPQAGQRLLLTIDAELQRFAQQRLSETRSATAVVMDAVTGEIYAMNSYPSFDPNEFAGGLSAARWEELLANPAHPLNNKAVSGQYPPGSTYKMVTALACMEHGLINDDTAVFCTGRYDYGDSLFHCWKRGGHGWVGVRQALAQSCDTFFYKLSTELGIENLAEMSRRMGLGEPTGLGFPEEKAGVVPDQKWKRGRFGSGWQPGETIIASIGQGYLLTTPIQLAVMQARTVNGGYAVNPTLFTCKDQSCETQASKLWPSLDLNPYHLKVVQEGLDMVVNHQKGTARASRAEDEALAFGGKTGTAQVRRITMQQRLAGVKNEDLPWDHRHHALFTGYAPLNNPRYVCSVVVEHGVSGSGAAAPIARDLLLMAQKRNPAKAPVGARGI